MLFVQQFSNASTPPAFYWPSVVFEINIYRITFTNFVIFMATTFRLVTVSISWLLARLFAQTVAVFHTHSHIHFHSQIYLHFFLPQNFSTRMSYWKKNFKVDLSFRRMRLNYIRQQIHVTYRHMRCCMPIGLACEQPGVGWVIDSSVSVRGKR